jgi:uncharacterized protein (DUF2141 family)
MKRPNGSSRATVVLVALAVFSLFLVSQPAQAFPNGDVFVSVESGLVNEYTPGGTLVQTLDTTQGGFTTGSAFDTAGNFYVTDFSASQVSEFDPSGTLLGTFGGGYATPESIVFDAAGNAYVGNLGGFILKFDSGGNSVATFSAGQTDWMDLAADQCTMFFTDEGPSIHRFDVCTNTALSDFASPGSSGFALRLLPTGGLLLANGNEIKRLDAAGNVIQTYDAPGEDSWFALNLDPDGTTFWSADFTSSNVYRFNINTGAQVSSFNSGTPGNTVFGLSVQGEITVAQPTLTLEPATASNTVGSSHTVTATLNDGNGDPISGATILFSVSGANSASGSGATDPNGQTTFTYTGTNVGGDAITACYDKNSNGSCDSGETTATATKDWTQAGAVPAKLVLSPKTASNTAGQQHCVTATVTDAGGTPTPNVTVVFTVSGANSASGSQTTDASGEAQFCYTGTTAGSDTISAFADTNTNGTQDTDEPGDTASKTYVAAPPTTLVLSPKTAENTVDAQHCVTATVADEFGNPTPDITVVFTVSGANSASGSPTTDANGEAQFCYTGTTAGTDTISAFADTNTNGTQDTDEPGDTATKTYVLPASTPGCKVTGGGQIIATNGDAATFGGNAQVGPTGAGVKGEEQFTDPGPATMLEVHSISIQAVVCSADKTQASIFGTATINGTGSFDFRIDVKDLGQPGRNDTYRIRLSNGYDSGEQKLTGGNIKIH